MSDYHGTPTQPKARKEHRCIFCGGPIVVGEKHVQQTGFYDGRAYRNRYHNECWDELDESGDFEFTPYNGEYPERVRAIVDQRIEGQADGRRRAK